MAEKAAFKIAAPIFFPNGFRARRTDYLEVEDADTLALLRRAKGGTVTEIPLRGADPEAVEAEEEPEGADEESDEGGEGESQASGEVEPDWEFMTIPSTRKWLDQAGVELPSKRAGKAAHEKQAREAWKGGARPNPLWGLTGGPEPSPGIGCAPETLARLDAAIAECEAAGLAVPAETVARRAELALQADATTSE